MEYELRHLIDRLNSVCRHAMEDAAQRCVSQTHYDVEIEHFLLALIDRNDTDIFTICRNYNISFEAVSRGLTITVDGFKRGNSRTPGLSPKLTDLIRDAWMLSSLAFQEDQVRSGAILLTLMENARYKECLSRTPIGLLSHEKLRGDMDDIFAESPEQTGSPTRSAPAKKAPARTDKPKEKARKQKTPNLDQYTIDLIEEARTGKIDAIVGRDHEIRLMIDILTRRRQNNPILIGEAGVGKTAVVEGFALRVFQGDVPPALEDVGVRSLDLGLLQAGTGIRGEFEKRLKALMSEIAISPQPIILFIDEAHTLIGAGGSEGQGDAANLIKPALARGELRTIAATTWAEYKKYFEKDAALSRRFQPVKIDEPDEERAVLMLRAIAIHFEKHHGVRILDEAVRDAVMLSKRYITGRQLPDKAVSVLDTACARVSLHQNAKPAALEAAERDIQHLDHELTILEREASEGADHDERRYEIVRSRDVLEAKRKELERQWREELEIVETYEQSLSENASPRELSELKEQLATRQGQHPMIPLCVDSALVAEVISGWTGIPVGRMLTDDIQKALTLKAKLGERVIGQDHALDVISRRIGSSKADLADPGKPVGVFLLAGSSGIGKTETAHALAELMYGGERNLITVNMSEFQEAHSVSSLKGAPPGYVGYGKGGVLTEAIRRAPYSVVLLDEIEKAHSDVLEVFYQVFDKGYMEDGDGQKVDFKNTIILLTSNLGSDLILDAVKEGNAKPEYLEQTIRPILSRRLKDAFLGRLVIVPYLPLEEDILRQIVTLKLDKVIKRFSQRHKAKLHIDQALVDHITRRCTEVASGARNIDNIITQALLPELSYAVLTRMAESKPFASARIHLDEENQFTCSFTDASG